MVMHAGVPTGGIFIPRKNLSFRSPDNYGGLGSAYQVVSNGNVDYSHGIWNVENSYGIILTPRKN